MIYDTPIQILRLPDTAGTPLQTKLQQEFSAYCGEMEVWHRRFWEAQQAGSRIDAMVELPLHRKIDGSNFVELDGHIYKVVQAQRARDEFDLPVTRLSLSRTEDAYDIAEPG